VSGPLVSLLVPNMNNGPALDVFFRTLERNTTYRNIEVVVVDDGSTDSSLRVLRRWRESGRFPDFTLIEREHSGIIDTLNEGLAYVKGELVVRMDGDATVETPGWLEKMMRLQGLDESVGVVAGRVVLDSGLVHAYGVTGIVTEVTVRTDPAREWVALYASFPTYAGAVAVHRKLPDLPILPRLASVDEPGLVATLPAPIDLDASMMSLRIILEPSTVPAVSSWVRAAGGDVVRVLEGYEQTDRLSGMSYNHPVYFLQRSGYPCFHLEVNGLPLWDDPDAVRSVYPNSMIHLELGPNRGPFAMLVADYQSERQVLDGFDRLRAIGINIHSPHQWNVDRNVGLIASTVPRTDPKGLLNPGKLP
jgi:glycosyltransferase involved in cell wall biosynthesis